MSSEQKHKGRWYLPNRSENKVAGDLMISSSNVATLELHGSLGEQDDLNSEYRYQLILGVTISGTPITLHRCRGGFTTSWNDVVSYQFRAHRVFIGAHFTTEEELNFRHVSVHYAHLEDWVNRQDIDVKHDYDTWNVNIRYEQSVPIVLTLAGYQVTITTSPAVKGGLYHAELTQTAWIDLSASEAKSLDEYLVPLYHIQNFLSLGIGAPTYALEMVGSSDARVVEERGQKAFPPIQIHEQVADRITESRRIHPAEMLFTLEDVQGNLERYLSNWIGSAALLAPVYDLFFATRYNPHLYVQSAFLSLTQAAETYHRRRIDHGKCILVKRLEDLVQRIKGPVPLSSIGINGDPQKFIQTVRDTRNYLTHYDQKYESRAASGLELRQLTAQLEALLETYLLTELGFDFADLRRMLARQSRHKYIW